MSDEIRMFQNGSMFPSIVGATICFRSSEAMVDLKIKNLKNEVLDYLKTHGIVRISELAEKFDVPPRIVGQALNELEDEGIIKAVD